MKGVRLDFDIVIEFAKRYEYLKEQIEEYSESKNYIYNDYQIAERNTIYETLRKEKIWIEKIIEKFKFETDINCLNDI